jgi:hypothetical protein
MRHINCSISSTRLCTYLFNPELNRLPEIKESDITAEIHDTIWAQLHHEVQVGLRTMLGKVGGVIGNRFTDCTKADYVTQSDQKELNLHKYPGFLAKAEEYWGGSLGSFVGDVHQLLVRQLRYHFLLVPEDLKAYHRVLSVVPSIPMH